MARPNPAYEQEHVMNRVLDELTKPNQTVAWEQIKQGCYPYIPLPASVFMTGLVACREYLFSSGRRDRDRPYQPSLWNRPKFLDVGCGTGAKLMLAKHLGFDASGIEIEAAYIQQANDLGYSVTEADGRTWTGYDQYDVVYAYCPHNSIVEERILEDWICSRLKPGALFLIYLGSYDAEHPGCRQVEVDLGSGADGAMYCHRPTLWERLR